MPNCRAINDGLMPALNAARTALTWPRVNETVATAACRLWEDLSLHLFLIEELRSVFVELVGLSHRAAARTLNERGVKTATGKPWSPVTVTRVRQRLDLI
jgi:recombinase